jgi:ubiquinone biosynthesis accessory factor UbiJ
MATQSPFSFAPPDWAIDEIRRRVILLLNHVLMQETEATSRLSRLKGQMALVQWRSIAIKIIVTPAGLLDLADPGSHPDLTLALTQDSPLAILQAVLKGEKPTVRIEGDVQLAAEVNWLVDHVRWDIEEDLARVIGDVPAHALGQAARRLGDALRQFVGTRNTAAEPEPAVEAGSAPPGGGAPT